MKSYLAILSLTFIFMKIGLYAQTTVSQTALTIELANIQSISINKYDRGLKLADSGQTTDLQNISGLKASNLPSVFSSGKYMVKVATLHQEVSLADAATPYLKGDADRGSTIVYTLESY